MEGMRMEQNAAEAIAESCGNDIRQVLNCMQMWANKKGGNQTMTYKDVKERQYEINKDDILRVSLFDATKLIVEGPKGLVGEDPAAVKASFYKRNDAFFVDYSLLGLNVHQNYLKVMNAGYAEANRSGDTKKMVEFLESMHDAALAMSDYAIADNAVRGIDQNWSLLPTCGVLAVKTGFHAAGENGGYLSSFPEFTAWLGKNSSRGKKSRLLQELGHHMNYKVSGGATELRLNYLPLLRERFSVLLSDKNGIRTSEAIQLMDEYGLDREDIFENLDEFKMDPNAKSFSELLDSQEKSAFTREYNAGTHKSQALVDEQGAGKVSRKTKATSEKDPADLDALDDDAALEESESESDEMDEEKLRALFKRKGKKSSAATKKRASSGKGKKKK
jgi:replication factor C subunit 1